MLLAAVLDSLCVPFAEEVGITGDAVAACRHASLHVLLPGAIVRIGNEDVELVAKTGSHGAGQCQEKQQRHHRHGTEGPITLAQTRLTF